MPQGLDSCNLWELGSIWKAVYPYVSGQSITFWLSSLTSGKVAKERLCDMNKAIYCKLYVVALFILNTWPQVGRSSSWGCPGLLQSPDCSDLPHVCASAPYTCSWSPAWVLLPLVYESTCLTDPSGPLFNILEASPLFLQHPHGHLATVCNYLFTGLSFPGWNSF